MIKRICPICDQEMKSAHYCGVCKRFVRDPWVREVDYYLNESHPAGEQDCSYHNAGETDRARQHGWKPSGNTRSGQASGGTRTGEAAGGRGRKDATVWTADGMPVSRRGEAAGRMEQTLKRQRSGTRTIAAVILIFCAISMAGGVVSQLSKPSLSFDVPEPEYDVDLGDYTGDDWDSYEEDYTTLTDEEAIALGEACTDSGHFSCSGEELVEPITEILNNCGFEVDTVDTPSSINEQYEDGSSWYETWVTLELPYSDNSVYQSVEINYDTVTKELHSICIYMENPEETADVAGMIMLYLEEQGLVKTSGNCAFVVMQEMAAAMAEDEEYCLEDGEVTVNSYLWADAWQVNICPADEE